jgi:hypothetical protein
MRLYKVKNSRMELFWRMHLLFPTNRADDYSVRTFRHKSPFFLMKISIPDLLKRNEWEYEEISGLMLLSFLFFFFWAARMPAGHLWEK